MGNSLKKVDPDDSHPPKLRGQLNSSRGNNRKVYPQDASYPSFYGQVIPFGNSSVKVRPVVASSATGRHNVTNKQTDEIVKFLSEISPDFTIYTDLIKKNKVCGQDILTYSDRDDLSGFLDYVGVANDFHRMVITENIAALLSPSPATTTSTGTTGGTLPFPKQGVLLSVFLDFMNECGGITAFNGLTTTDVNNKFQKPLTYVHRSSYCELLQKRGSSKVGEASVFISHAWKYIFLDVIDALTNRFKDSGDVFIWFDMFSNNQHAGLGLEFNWWCTTFKSAIEQFGHTVMILSPWNNPIPLTRAWCLFELYCTAETKSRFEIVMSPSDEQTFITAIRKACTDEMNKMLATINVRTCEAWNPEDRRRIFEVVEILGFDKINMMVFELMRDWVVETTSRHMDSASNQEERLGLMNALGVLFKNQGRYKDALPLYEACLQLRKEVLGERHPDTLESMNNLAYLFLNQGRYDDALPLLEACLQLRKEVSGERHADTLASMNNLAGLFYSQRRYEDALPLYEACLQLNKEVLGERNPNTLTSMNNLAGLYKRQGRYKDALPLYEACLQLKKEVLGERNPDTLTSMNNLAGLYDSKGRNEDALPMYEACLQLRKEVLGERNPNTLTSMNNLAGLYGNQGRYEDALPLYEACVQLRKEVLGERHPDTLTSMNNLAGLYDSKGRYEDALPMYEACVQLRKVVLGERHPDTLASMNNLAGLYDSKGRNEDALPLFASTCLM